MANLICGEILTQNGCHESPGQTDRLLTDEVPPLLPRRCLRSQMPRQLKEDHLHVSNHNAISAGIICVVSTPRLVAGRSRDTS